MAVDSYHRPTTNPTYRQPTSPPDLTNYRYYGARSACEPLHVQADPRTGQVIAVNHTSQVLKGAKVTARLYDLSGRQHGATRTAGVEVAAAATTRALTVGWTDDLPDLHLLRLTLEDSAGRPLSRNTYWRQRTPAALKALNAARKVKLSASVSRLSQAGARHEMTATVRNRGTAVAAMVRLSLLDGTGRERVLPTLYSDNYLWLLPGESRQVTLSWPASALESGRPSLQVEAYNSDPVLARS